MLCVDGGSGLLAALHTASPEVPVQRCWAHEIRNALAKVRKPDQPWLKADLHRVMNATSLPAAWSDCPARAGLGPRSPTRPGNRRFADRWQDRYPKAVARLRADLADVLTSFRYPTLRVAQGPRHPSRHKPRDGYPTGQREYPLRRVLPIVDAALA